MQGCTLVATNDTYSTCACSRFGSYALLAENHIPYGLMPQSAYNIVYYFYYVSVVLLLFFMVVMQLLPAHKAFHNQDF